MKEAAIRRGLTVLPPEERLTPTGLKILQMLSKYGPTYSWEFPMLLNAGNYSIGVGMRRARKLGLAVSKRTGRGANLPMLWEITAEGEKYLASLKVEEGEVKRE